MAYSEDHIALAAEYALGTLDADERALVETMLIVDPGFLALVEAWEHKLAPLHQMVSSVEPPADLWDRIKTTIALSAEQTPVVLPDDKSEEAPVHAIDPVTLEMTSALNVSSGPDATSVAPEGMAPAEQIAPVVAAAAKPSSGTGARIFGTAMSTAAIVLAGVIGLQIYRPAALPAALRIKPEIRTVEIKTPPPPVAAQWVAALQSDARDPGFVLTVDAASRRYTVRRIGPPPAAGKSYELWIVPGKFGEPHSVGVIDSEFTASDGLAGYDADTVNNSIYAVTVEARGGSPSGKPTAQPLWAGKLYESVPSH